MWDARRVRVTAQDAIGVDKADEVPVTGDWDLKREPTLS